MANNRKVRGSSPRGTMCSFQASPGRNAFAANTQPRGNPGGEAVAALHTNSNRQGPPLDQPIHCGVGGGDVCGGAAGGGGGGAVASVGVGVGKRRWWCGMCACVLVVWCGDRR